VHAVIAQKNGAEHADVNVMTVTSLHDVQHSFATPAAFEGSAKRLLWHFRNNELSDAASFVRFAIRVYMLHWPAPAETMEKASIATQCFQKLSDCAVWYLECILIYHGTALPFLSA
jgi:hypothetical protein